MPTAERSEKPKAESHKPKSPQDTEAQYLKGIGPKLAELLAKAGLKTVGDVLYHLPRRYEDRRNIPPIGSLRPGEWATIKGKVLGVQGRPTRRGMVLIRVPVTDGRNTIVLTWFNQPWIKKKFESFQGEVLAYGQIKEGSYELEMHSPEYELLSEDRDENSFAKITPIYPLVEGVNQNLVRRAVGSALDNYLRFVQDPLPESIQRQHKLKPLQWSLTQVHRPESDDQRLEGRKRLVFDEFLTMQLSLAMSRAETQHEIGIAFRFNIDEIKKDIKQMLPFELTNAQKRVIKEIWADMQSPHPMNRLLQGDVGSGKTAVAAAAIVAAIRAGYQAALMAPTEILAEQHFNNLKALLSPLGIDVEFLVGKHTANQKKSAYKRAASGEAQLLIGTHAIIQEGVEFKHLGLVIIDEQHRFGVLQRAALREKGLGNPDVLVLTATPIPRTLTMTVFGDLDLSVIDELPPGRRPIKTHWKAPMDRTNVYDGVRKMVKEGRQAYIVCPLVEESEKAMALAAEEVYGRLSSQVFPDLRVGLIHGQKKSKEKEEVMDRFRRGELDILVSTTVIEVGVDVPNASVMVIEDANRFGLSQLHQLRGRVGRGAHQSFCILVADGRTEEAQDRMKIMVATTDGFKIAEEDLRMRGPGELTGTRQSGNLDFKIADLVQDGKMLEVARQAAIDIINRDPKLSKPEHRLLLERVKRRKSHLATVAVS